MISSTAALDCAHTSTLARCFFPTLPPPPPTPPPLPPPPPPPPRLTPPPPLTPPLTPLIPPLAKSMATAASCHIRAIAVAVLTFFPSPPNLPPTPPPPLNPGPFPAHLTLGSFRSQPTPLSSPAPKCS
ncbi:unnamed protein product [Closterium sp. NIES-54]